MLSADVQYDDRIDRMHLEIMDMIGDIQDKVKKEINFTKKEMEDEVISKFSEAEQKQQVLMNEKIEEQKRVFERMNRTKNEIDKIKLNFEQTNVQCENLLKENENLRILLESLETDNDSLTKKLNDLKKEYAKLAKEHMKLFKNEKIDNPFNIEIENYTLDEEDEGVNGQCPSSGREVRSFVEKESEDRVNTAKKTEKKTTAKQSIVKSGTPTLSNQSRIIPVDENNTATNPEDVIKLLKENIKNVRSEYKNLQTNYIEEQKKRNEAQQLMQKCIEDVNLEIKKSMKDISNFTKLYAGTRGFEDQLKAKQSNLESLENKMKILTFVYDNGIQNTKSKKAKLFS
jgi:hypothetical protein